MDCRFYGKIIAKKLILSILAVACLSFSMFGLVSCSENTSSTVATTTVATTTAATTATTTAATTTAVTTKATTKATTATTKTAVAALKSQALSLAKKYVEDNEMGTLEIIAYMVGLYFYGQPDWGAAEFTLNESDMRWEIELKGTIPGYVDAYKSEFARKKFRLTASVDIMTGKVFVDIMDIYPG